jgi:hypothetical protein
MKISNWIQKNNSGPVCKNCKYFQGHPAIVEKAYPGLSSLSSGFASVRDQDGFCNHHERYLSARDGCPDFVFRIASIANEEISAGIASSK